MYFWKSSDLDDTIKNVTVSRTGQHWFVAFQVELDLLDPLHPSSFWVGIDLGVARFAAISDGTLIPPWNALRTQEHKLALALQTLARKEQFSQNWKKQKARINRLYTKFAKKTAKTPTNVPLECDGSPLVQENTCGFHPTYLSHQL